MLWSWEGPLGTPLGLVQWKRASSTIEAGTSGFLSISDSDRRVPAELGQESQASSWVEAWNCACLLRSFRGDRRPVELYLEPAGFYRRCTGVSVPLRVGTSSTGWHSKRCPGFGFFSRADCVIGPRDALKKDSRGLSQVAAGNHGFPGLVPVTSGSFSGCL